MHVVTPFDLARLPVLTVQVESCLAFMSVNHQRSNGQAPGQKLPTSPMRVKKWQDVSS